MTRDEFDEEIASIRSNVGGYGNTKSSLGDLVYYVDELEKRITELKEPKTCEGCKHFRPNTDDEHEHCALMSNDCVRWYPELPDYYEPLS